MINTILSVLLLMALAWLFTGLGSVFKATLLTFLGKVFHGLAIIVVVLAVMNGVAYVGAIIGRSL